MENFYPDFIKPFLERVADCFFQPEFIGFHILKVGKEHLEIEAYELPDPRYSRIRLVELYHLFDAGPGKQKEPDCDVEVTLGNDHKNGNCADDGLYICGGVNGYDVELFILRKKSEYHAPMIFDCKGKSWTIRNKDSMDSRHGMEK